jgi:acetoin utilization deacetylase AcuC-like enzyme
MKVYFYNRTTLQLPPGHRFPSQKYPMLLNEIRNQKILREDELIHAQQATREQVILAHTVEYFDSIYSGSIDPKIMRQIGLPWSESLVERSLASVGGSISAANDALITGISGNLGGGTHHAMADQGMGYCVFNDLAVVILNLILLKKISRASIIDLDVHQGNGNAAILGSHPEVFTFSMQGQKNYPYRKVPSTLDINLPDGIGDGEYLQHLITALPKIFDFKPDIIFYLAGVDPLQSDRLGRLSLTMKGLGERDWLVLEQCQRHSIPVCLVLGGGYAVPIELTVQAHVQTYRIVKEVFQN